MKQELLHKLNTITPDELHKKLIQHINQASVLEMKHLNSILKDNFKEERIKFGEISIPRSYFIKVTQSDIMRHATNIISVASNSYPISTIDILIHAGIRPVTPLLKIQTGHLLTLAGFKKVSVYRKGQTPTKLWEPIDKSIDDTLRAEYFFSLLKDHVKITDTKILDDLI
jgi:UTP:GlnB (protein PII) uridylyltransferase